MLLWQTKENLRGSKANSKNKGKIVGAEPTVRLSFSKVLDSAITHNVIMHPYIIASLLITSCLGGYFGSADAGIVMIDCHKDIHNEMGFSSTDYDDRDCKKIEYEDQDFNRSESRKKVGTEERKGEDSDSKGEFPEKS